MVTTAQTTTTSTASAMARSRPQRAGRFPPARPPTGRWSGEVPCARGRSPHPGRTPRAATSPTVRSCGADRPSRRGKVPQAGAGLLVGRRRRHLGVPHDARVRDARSGRVHRPDGQHDSVPRAKATPLDRGMPFGGSFPAAPSASRSPPTPGCGGLGARAPGLSDRLRLHRRTRWRVTSSRFGTKSVRCCAHRACVPPQPASRCSSRCTSRQPR